MSLCGLDECGLGCRYEFDSRSPCWNPDIGEWLKDANQIEIGRRIKTLREAATETRDDLAKVTRINPHMLYAYEEGDAHYKTIGDDVVIIHMTSISAHYGVSIRWLLHGKNEGNHDK